MEEFKDKSNNDLLMEVKNLQSSHEALKAKMLKDYDEMIAIETRFNRIQELLNKRLKGELK